MEIKQNHDERHVARLLAVQYFFTLHQAEEKNRPISVYEPNTIVSLLEEKKYNVNLYEEIVGGTEQNIKELDQIIRKFAPQRPLEEINPVNLIILRIAIWEGFLGKITPKKVVINEAIELAKAFGSVEDGKFINGVLGNLLDTNIEK